MRISGQEYRPSGFVVGLLCGAIVGAAFGLIFAPVDGRQFRQQLENSMRRVGDRSYEVYQQALRAMGDVVDAGRDALHSARGDGTAAAAPAKR